MKKVLALAILAFSVFSCSRTEPNKDQVAAPQPVAEPLEDAKRFFSPIPVLAESKDNPVTPQKVALGKSLFYDTRLSKDGKNSCNSCHNLENFGVDGEATSQGDAGKRGDRNSPTVLNAAFHSTQFWDGRAKDVEEQAGGPILNPAEMAVPTEAFLVKRLSEVPEYRKLFAEAFPEERQPISYTNIRRSIAAFERTLITPCRFDRYLEGDVNALSAEEKSGLKLYIETGCVQCHAGPMLGGMMLQKFGIYADYRSELKGVKDDPGRMNVTRDSTDKDVFKVPALRNIAMTGPYFHNGSVRDLDEAVRIMGKVQLNKALTPEQRKSIITFLGALTGEVPVSAKR